MPATPEQLAELLTRHGPALVLLARQWCQASEDVVQDAFLKLAEQPRVPSSVGAWLFTVVRWAAISQGRKERRRRMHEERAASLVSGWFMPNPEASLTEQEAAEALQALPAHLREVVIAHLWGGLTFVEVAKVVGGSASTAHRLYHEGLHQLRQALEGTCVRNTAETC